MAYDERLAERVRDLVKGAGGIEEKKMFGGLTFMVHGHMSCGVAKGELMVRVGPDLMEAALREPHTRPCDFTGRPMKNLVLVAAPGFASDAALTKLVGMAVEFVSTLPPK